MKTFYKSLVLVAVAATALVSCNKEIEAPVEEKPVVKSHVEFFAESVAPSTKATLTTEDEKSFIAAWEVTDKVSLYAYNGDEFDEEKPATWNKTKGAFEADFDTATPKEKQAWMYEAKYPYSADGNIPFGGARVQNGNAYNSAYDIMYGTVDYTNALLGKDDNDNVFVIPMNRLTGIAYFHITGGPDEDVVSATLEATGIAAENVTIATDGKSVAASTGSASLDAITITFADGTAPKATNLKLWFNVLPGSYTGLKLTIVTTNKVSYLQSKGTMTYTAGKINKVVLSDLAWLEPAKYEKVTSTAGVTEGKYLIVYEAGNVAFDGSLSTLDAANNNIAVTINDGKITPTDAIDASQFIIESYDGGFSLQSASGYYVGAKSTGKEMVTSTTTPVKHTITVSNGVASIKAATATAGYLKFNSAADQKRFRYYNSGQQSVALYKLSDGRSNASGISFANASYTFELGDDDYNAFAGQTANLPDGNQAVITYSMSGDEIGFIDSATGEILLNDATIGTATVTATATASGNYRAGSATYTITVTPKGGSEDLTTATATFTGAASGGMTSSQAKQTGVRRNVTAVISSGWADASNNHIRIYQDATLTISVPSGAKITRVEFDVTSGYSLANLSNHTDGVWNGNAESVAFTASKQVRVDAIRVTYKIATSSLAYYTPTINAVDKSIYTDDDHVAIGATSDSPGTISYSIKSGSSYISLNPSTGVVTPVAIGTAVVTVYVEASGDYEAASKDISVTVSERPLGTLKTKTLSMSYSSHDGWTITGTDDSTGTTKYYIMKSGAVIESPSFSFNSIQSVKVKTRTYSSKAETDVYYGSTKLGTITATGKSLVDETLTIDTSPAAGTGTVQVRAGSDATTSQGAGVQEVTITYDVYE